MDYRLVTVTVTVTADGGRFFRLASNSGGKQLEGKDMAGRGERYGG